MSVLPFPSFLDDVKEKGLKRAVFEGLNEATERLTSGLNIQDLREALRGGRVSDAETVPMAGGGMGNIVTSLNATFA